MAIINFGILSERMAVRPVSNISLSVNLGGEKRSGAEPRNEIVKTGAGDPGSSRGVWQYALCWMNRYFYILVMDFIPSKDRDEM